jgi:hypothetical protein
MSSVGQPFTPRWRHGLVFRALETVAVVLGMAARDPFALAARIKLLELIGPGRIEQSKPRIGAADIHHDQRFRHQIGQAVDCISARCCRIHGNGRSRLAGSGGRPGGQSCRIILKVLFARFRPALNRADMAVRVAATMPFPPSSRAASG